MKMAKTPKSKRIFDLIVTSIGMVFALPVMAVLAIFVRLKIGSPVLFKQYRPGLNEKLFMMYKFRTMQEAYDESGQLLPDDCRLTGFGRKLRSTSLDELPELFCVLKGDMSLVGPRPLLRAYLDRYSDEQHRRHLVLPGITGWAQINGRNAISWEEKFSLDTWYVDHWSFGLDIKILLLTIIKVFKREGISGQDQATMEEFKGS
jgi:lipopolysaccharide/colanic/teichoic acid biosynthesis glycosyltransferase